MPFTWATLWLILHITSFVVGFGPDYLLPFMGRRVEKEPQHALFVTEVVHGYTAKVTIPLAFLVPTFGVLLIVTRRFDFWKSEWLIIAAALYLLNMIMALFVLHPASGKAIQLMKSMPPGPPPAGGPPPELQRLIRRQQAVGGFLLFSLLVFFVLMVWKPGAAFLPPKF